MGFKVKKFSGKPKPTDPAAKLHPHQVKALAQMIQQSSLTIAHEEGLSKHRHRPAARPAPPQHLQTRPHPSPAGKPETLMPVVKYAQHRHIEHSNAHDGQHKPPEVFARDPKTLHGQVLTDAIRWFMDDLESIKSEQHSAAA